MVVWIVLLIFLIEVVCDVLNVRLMIDIFGVGMWIVMLFSFLFSFGRIRLIVLVVLVEVGIIDRVVVWVWYRFLCMVFSVGWLLV